MEDFATYDLPRNELDGSFTRIDGHMALQGRWGNGTPKGHETRNVTGVAQRELSFPVGNSLVRATYTDDTH
jgi:hypothetical protein